MWRSSVSYKRSEASLSPTSPVNTSTDSIDKATSPSRKGTLNSRTSLSEILKTNPFRLSSKDVSQTQEPQPEDPVRSLNKDLHLVATIYPDVQLDVLRELLSRFDGHSRLQVCVEQLFRYKSEWARGRLLNPPRDPEDDIPADELFRHQGYINACKRTHYNEFKGLNKSAVDAVLAEVNNSYSKARPILQDIASKTWRATLTGFFCKRKANQEPPSFLFERGRSGEQFLLSTGNAELDQELRGLFSAASHVEQIIEQKQTDYQLANKLNYEQAEEAGALFECQCCFDDVPFEQITTCAAEGHVLCVECVQKTFNEALFGQSWSKSIASAIGSLTCFAPLDSGQCESYIPQDLVHSAMASTKSGGETWSKFEQRLASENLSKTNLPLQTCPFCPYAEIRESRTFESAASLKWRFRLDRFTVMGTILLLISFDQLLLVAMLSISLLGLAAFLCLPRHSFQQSLINISEQRQTHKFKCQSASCGKTSCTVCHKQWHDPHICHEPLIQSLRNTVEAARTAALKRVCPRCGTGFVKSSGCNKLVCVCGYAMCYLCRKNIGKVSGTAGVANDADVIAAGEGYRHFCPHFRPVLGQKCTECDKCDLYKNEDEDALVRRAGEVAEQEWRAKYEEDMSSQAGSNKANLAGLENALAGIDDNDYSQLWRIGKRLERMAWKTISDIRTGQFKVQGTVDWIVERIVIVEDDRT